MLENLKFKRGNLLTMLLIFEFSNYKDYQNWAKEQEKKF